MPSARAPLLNFITRIAMRLIFRRMADPATYRDLFVRLERKRRLPPMPAGTSVEEVREPIAGRWVRCGPGRSKRVILYLHGGAFIMRLEEGHTRMVARVCAAGNVDAFMAWYRLAPEHPFPAAPQDALAAYRHLLGLGYAPSDIVIMGDSAGGNLTLAVLHLIRGAGLPMPAGAAALSPITDFAQISATWRQNDCRDPMYRVQHYVNPVRHYLQGASPVDPIASPYYGDLRGFPPLLLVLGGLEALLDDSVGMVRKAIEHGVSARLQVWRGMPHVFPLHDTLPEASIALREIAAWLAERAGPDVPRSPPWHSAVELFDVAPLTGRVRRTTNDVDLGLVPIPSPTASQFGDLDRCR